MWIIAAARGDNAPSASNCNGATTKTEAWVCTLVMAGVRPVVIVLLPLLLLLLLWKAVMLTDGAYLVILCRFKVPAKI